MLTAEFMYRWWYDELNMSVSMGGMIQTRGTPKYSERNVPQCHFLATNPSWTGLGSNPGLRMGWPLPELWHSHYGHRYGVVTLFETLKSRSFNSIGHSLFTSWSFLGWWGNVFVFNDSIARGAEISGAWSTRATDFLMMVPTIFCTITAVPSPPICTSFHALRAESAK